MFFSKQSLRPCVLPRRYRVRVSQRCSLVLIGRAHAPNASRSTSRKRGAGAILRKAIPLPDSRADNSPYFLSSPSMIGRGKEEERNPRMARTGLRRGRVMTATSASVPRSSLRVFQTSSLLTRRPTLNGLRRAILSTLVALSLQSPFCFDPSDVTYPTTTTSAALPPSPSVEETRKFLERDIFTNHPVAPRKGKRAFLLRTSHLRRCLDDKNRVKSEPSFR